MSVSERGRYSTSPPWGPQLTSDDWRILLPGLKPDWPLSCTATVTQPPSDPGASRRALNVPETLHQPRTGNIDQTLDGIQKLTFMAIYPLCKVHPCSRTSCRASVRSRVPGWVLATRAGLRRVQTRLQQRHLVALASVREYIMWRAPQFNAKQEGPRRPCWKVSESSSIQSFTEQLQQYDQLTRSVVKRGIWKFENDFIDSFQSQYSKTNHDWKLYVVAG